MYVPCRTMQRYKKTNATPINLPKPGVIQIVAVQSLSLGKDHLNRSIKTV
jgi:hypothetical protein